MSDSFEQRAERRRATWSGGVAASFEEMADADLEFWLRATPGERVRAVHQLTLEVDMIRGGDGSPSRLQRSLGGVRPRGG